MNEYNHNDFSLFHQLNRISSLMHRYHHQTRMARGPMGDVGRGQGRVLALLLLQPEIRQRDLGYLLDMRPQSLGELLVKLENAGYIERMPSDEDKRAMIIKLTEAGKTVAAQGSAREASFGDVLTESLTDEERMQLRQILDKLIDALEARTDSDSSEQWHPRGDWSEEDIRRFRERGFGGRGSFVFGRRGGFKGPHEERGGFDRDDMHRGEV